MARQAVICFRFEQSDLKQMSTITLPYRKANFPEGVSGEWVLEHFEVPPSPFADPTIDTRPVWARTPPGRYTRLRRGHEPFMTDMIDEWWTQLSAIEEARSRGGRILITGLGLGLIAEAILEPPEGSVERITIVERSDDVMRLVAPHLLARYPDRLEIVSGDAFTWTPPAGVHYSVCWHDIWPNPRDPACRAEIQRLEARYAPWCDWQGSWTLPE